MAINFQSIEKKWQKAWEKARLGEADASPKKKKYFLIFAYPTVSGYQHTGHMRGFSYVDDVCRYKRMKGFNVLFPVGSHATGNGAIAKAQRIKERDPKWLAELKAEGASEADIKKISEPDKFVDFFNKSYIREWKQFGFLADNRRFITTITPDYNKFIEWQFRKLHQLNLLVQKPYFATACVRCGPVSVDPAEMDLLKGGNAEQQEFTILKFRFDDKFLVAATLRPETVFGQTNLWANPEVKYSVIQVGKEKWVVSPECAEKLKYQKENIKLVGSIDGRSILGQKVTAPGINREIPILPADFCDPKIGTGIVTSVPSDAPYDYVALMDLKKDRELCKKYGIDWKAVQDIKIIPIIETKDWGDKAAEKIVLQKGIASQKDAEKLELATQEIYKAGFHSGTMNKNCGRFAGMKVSEAKDKVKDMLISDGLADIMQELSEEVVCRCGSPVVIKNVPHQWFIRYSDKELNQKSVAHAGTMNILPEDYKKNIPETLEWFHDRPCARQGRWMGTTFPFDKSYIIEAISDSTLYPIYYLVSKYVNEKKLKPAQMTEEFFDFVYLGKGSAKAVSKQTKVPEKLLEKIRADVEYWYPLDINLGGKEHKTVHFPPFIKSHIAILPEKYWPKGIVVNGWIVGKGGTKFSKSKGNAELIPEVSKKYGVDAMRLYYANIANLFVDVEFDSADVLNYKQRLRKIFEFACELAKLKGKAGSIDRWLASRMNGKLNKISEAFDSWDLKTASDIIYSEIYNDLRWYARRKGCDKKTIKNTLGIWIKLMAPITPHLAEELWHKLGQKGFVSLASWPEFDTKMIDEKAEKSEEAVRKTIDDINNIIKIVNRAPKKICLYVIPPELELYKSAEKFYSEEFRCEVKVFAVNDKNKYDPENKSLKAKPGKQGIYIE